MTTDTIRTGSGDEGGFGASIADAVRRVQDGASVDRVYGEPIAVDGKLIVPVARVRYGFGVGFGSGGDEDGHESDDDRRRDDRAADAGTAGSDETAAGEGGGAGGGLTASPVGVLEITADETRFLRITNWPGIALAVGLGIAIGIVLGRR